MWNGRFNQQRYVNCVPRPLQHPHPPIWIPGGGSVETWNWCARMDYVYCYLSYYGYKVAARTMRGYWKEMESLGKEPNPYRAGFLQFVGVESEHQGRGIGSGLMVPILERCDREGERAYLDATNPENKRLYERHGFRAEDEYAPEGGPPLWPMWREPRGSGS